MTPTADQIMEAIPTCSLGWAVALAEAMPHWAINSTVRAEMFLAQCAHECAGFTVFVENLNYSDQGLMRTWPSRFPTLEAAHPYARNPEALANHVYANRLGNGNEASGDGYLYRGRGAIQITGRSNYHAAGEALHYPLERYPQDVAAPTYGAQAAAWFWQSHGLNELADAGRYAEIGRRINGGDTGKADRDKWLATVRATITDPNGPRLA